jgi:hypothetical protein
MISFIPIGHIVISRLGLSIESVVIQSSELHLYVALMSVVIGIIVVMLYLKVGIEVMPLVNGCIMNLLSRSCDYYWFD